MLENWRYASRLSRAVFVAIALLGVLLWTLWNWPAPMTSRAVQTGHVVSAAKDGLIQIKLGNGKYVYALAPNLAPKPGDKLPMIVETYEDGTIRAFIDHNAARN